jgi:hypothetical protein
MKIPTFQVYNKDYKLVAYLPHLCGWASEKNGGVM